MKKLISLITIALISINLYSQVKLDTLTNNEIIKMTEGGLSSVLIITKIQSSIKSFDVSTEGLIALNKSKVSVEVISEMLKLNNKIRVKNINEKEKSRIYFGIDGGYGFATAKAAGLPNSNTSHSSLTYTTTFTSKSYSYGQGVTAGVYLGCVITKHLSSELCSNYLFVNESKVEDYEYSKGRMIRLIPSIKIAIGDKKLQLYLKTGIIIGLNTQIITEYNYNNSTMTKEYKGRTSIGYCGKLGMNLKLADKINLFAELAAYYQNWAPKKSIITKDIQNGIDILSAMTISEKETIFLSHGSNDYNYNGYPLDPTQPHQSDKIYLPFSSIGINIGIQFYFGKGQKIE